MGKRRVRRFRQHSCPVATRPHPEPDEYVVDTAPLARILAEFVTNWRRERPNTQCRRGARPDELQPVSAYDWLAAESQVPVDTIKAIRRPARMPIVGFSVADALVASIGRPDWMHDGTLTVKPNPRLTAREG